MGLFFLLYCSVGSNNSPTINGNIKSNKYCNIDGTKCIDLSDSNKGDILYAKTLVWNLDYNKYNTDFTNSLNKLGITGTNKQFRLNTCLYVNGQVPSSFYNSPIIFEGCGKFLCNYKNGIWPFMSRIGSTCNANNGNPNCNNGNFIVSWTCLSTGN